MFIADFHIHSRFSRATSRDCVPEMLDWWARRKGLQLIGTGDFTHPAWREELRQKFEPDGTGLYRLKESHIVREGAPFGEDNVPRFIISGEISSIYKRGDKVRKVHNVILLPGLEEAEKLSQRLEQIGNLHSDGRPILGLDSRDLLEIVLEVTPEAVFIPAHIWTPHFSMFGAFSGFDRIEDCFADLTPYIHAVETGLSSDPPMNWRLSALDRYTLVSNSDAHSPANLAREANLLDVPMTYADVAGAIEGKRDGFCGTLEFFPEEGKYHYDGHRQCQQCLKPSQTIEAGGRCPVCGRKITIGVLHRVEELADRPEGYRPEKAKAYESIVPLAEVIAASIGVSAASKKVKSQYEDLLHALGPELYILRQAPLEDIQAKAGVCVAEGVRRLREGKVTMSPGYDGEYGKVHILSQSDIDLLTGQMRLFSGGEATAKTKKRRGLEAVKKENKLETAAENPQPDLPSFPYGLNEEQWRAVSSDAAVTAVVAGPGTGKTRTLIYKIVHMVENENIQPSNITAVTFTNKAAREMRERLMKHFGSPKVVKAMHIGTFHSLCLDMLSRWEGEAARIRLVDETGAVTIAEDVRQQTDWTGSVRTLLQEVSRRKNGLPPEGMGAGIPDAVYEAYNAQLEAYGVLDFDDLLLKVLSRFEGEELISSEYAPFSYLLVDEFQDINDIQYRLIKAWAKNSRQVFAIGDPDQAIYGFRGSSARCFLRLEEDNPGAQTVHLVKNYRCVPEVLAAALPVIEAGGSPRRLEAVRPKGCRVGIMRGEDAFSEALFVVKEINSLVGGMDMLDAQVSTSARGNRQERNWGLSDIVVLYRTHRQAEMLEYCLQKEGIPYTVTGREDFLDDRRVRSCLAFFRCLLHPEDGLSLQVVLRRLAGMSGEALHHIMEDHKTCENSGQAVTTALEQAGDKAEKCRTAWQVLSGMKDAKPVEQIEQWMMLMGFEEDTNMQRLAYMADLHETMEGFLQTVSLGGEGDVSRRGGKVYTPDAVSLMTLHASKGLEFPVVFLCGLQKGLLPLENPQKLEAVDVEEERRLLYVGMTRAQDELTLCTGGEDSSFLADMPPVALQEAVLQRQPYQGKQLNLFDML